MRRSEGHASSTATNQEKADKDYYANPQHEISFSSGIGTDGQIPSARENAGAQRTSNFRLNSEDFLSASQLNPQQCAHKKSPNMRGLLPKPKVTPYRCSAPLPKDMARPGTTEVILLKGFPSSDTNGNSDKISKAKVVDEETARIV